MKVMFLAWYEGHFGYLYCFLCLMQAILFKINNGHSLEYGVFFWTLVNNTSKYINKRIGADISKMKLNFGQATSLLKRNFSCYIQKVTITHKTPIIG